MKKITTRDIKCFLLSMLFMFIIITIFEWPSVIKGFHDGYKAEKVAVR